MFSRPIALTIAGSDPSGGAGIQADLKTFHQFEVYGEAAITLLTVQNTVGVSRVEVMAPDLVAEQIEAILDDVPPNAAKIGALGNAAVAEMGPHRHEVDGPIAFGAWLGVHAMLLSGTRRKVDAFISWGWDYFSSKRPNILVDRPEAYVIDWSDDDDE